MTFNKVEPIPVIGVAPDSDPVTCIAINTSWVEILVGLVEKAYWPGFWEGTDPEIDQALSHVIQLAGMMVGSACVPQQVCTIYESSSSMGGSSVVGWQTRVLNGIAGSPSWVDYDPETNYFTPDAGLYYIDAIAPMYRVDKSILRFDKQTSPTTVLQGIAAQSSSNFGNQGFAFVRGLFAADGSDYYYFRQYCATANPDNGLGVGFGGGSSGYHTYATLWRLGDLPPE